jgi:hypothetical protein
MIKNILFDLGHVLLDLDFQRAENNFKALLQETFEDVYHGLHEQGHFLHYELGLFDEQEFTATIKQAAKKDISETAIIDAWNSMLVEIPSQRLKMLQEAEKTTSTFFYSAIPTPPTSTGWTGICNKPISWTSSILKPCFSKKPITHII